MAELTLESLAERVAALEKAVGIRAIGRRGTLPPVGQSGTGDWDTFEKACAQLRDTFDYEAVRLQDERDWEEARRSMG